MCKELYLKHLEGQSYICGLCFQAEHLPQGLIELPCTCTRGLSWHLVCDSQDLHGINRGRR